MKIKSEKWRVADLPVSIVRVNPRPQYQRTLVWSQSKKKLLIDSMLRGYDIPKFYLRATPSDTLYDFEVTDGQQRLTAIVDFMSEDLNRNYSLDEAIINDVNINKLTYDRLGSLKKSFDNFELNVVIIEDATPEEIRSLFARLQMGEQLNKVELRHAMASNIGAAILSVVDTHVFFKESKIATGRFKHQDYLDHAITISYNNGKTDLKAKNIEKVYKDFANAPRDLFAEYIGKANLILDWMTQINLLSKGIFKNKWAFIDIYWLLFQNIEFITAIDYKKFSEQLRIFEHKRISNHRNPEKLIEDSTSPIFDKDMYEYILAFKFSGNEMSKIETRNRVFTSRFLNNQIFNLKH